MLAQLSPRFSSTSSSVGDPYNISPLGLLQESSEAGAPFTAPQGLTPLPQEKLSEGEASQFTDRAEFPGDSFMDQDLHISFQSAGTTTGPRWQPSVVVLMNVYRYS